MRAVIFTDKFGRKHRSYIRNEDSDEMAEYGIFDDPPSVDDIDCEALKTEIHNALVDNGLFDWEDVQKSTLGLRVAETIVKRALSGIFHEKARQKKKLTTFEEV